MFSICTRRRKRENISSMCCPRVVRWLQCTAFVGSSPQRKSAHTYIRHSGVGNALTDASFPSSLVLGRKGKTFPTVSVWRNKTETVLLFSGGSKDNWPGHNYCGWQLGHSCAQENFAATFTVRALNSWNSRHFQREGDRMHLSMLNLPTFVMLVSLQLRVWNGRVAAPTSVFVQPSVLTCDVLILVAGRSAQEKKHSQSLHVSFKQTAECDKREEEKGEIYGAKHRYHQLEKWNSLSTYFCGAFIVRYSRLISSQGRHFMYNLRPTAAASPVGCLGKTDRSAQKGPPILRMDTRRNFFSSKSLFWDLASSRLLKKRLHLGE